MDEFDPHLAPILGTAGSLPGPKRHPERIDRILGLLREIWAEQPDTRLMQMLVSLAPQGPEPVPHLFYLEDARLEALLRQRLGPTPDEDDAPTAPGP